jgi:hypothetical protein
MNHQTVEVTAATAKMAAVVRAVLRDNLKTLAKITEKYPVEFAFGGFRFVFESKAEIEEVIRKLDEGVQRYAA